MATDNLVRWLNKEGYQPVFLPRVGVAPPELYVYAKRSLVRLGALNHYVRSDPKRPKNQKNRLPDMDFQRTSGKTSSGALSFLGNVLRALGISGGPEVNLSFAGEGSMIFKLTDVVYEETEPAWVAETLKGFVTDLLPNEFVSGEKLHVAYNYAYAARLEMRRADGQKFRGKLSGAEINDIFKLGTTGTVELQNEDTLAFKGSGNERIAFAYKAGRLHREDGVFKFFPQEIQNQGFSSAKDTGTSNPYIPARGTVLAIDNVSIPSVDR